MKINYSTGIIECKNEDELHTYSYMIYPRTIYTVKFNPPFGTDGGTGGKIIMSTAGEIIWLRDPIEGVPDWMCWMKGDIDSSDYWMKINDGWSRKIDEKETNRFINGKFDIYGEVFPVSMSPFLHTDKQIEGYVWYGYGPEWNRSLVHGEWFMSLKQLTPYYKKVYINIEDILMGREGLELAENGYVGRLFGEPYLLPNNLKGEE